MRSSTDYCTSSKIIYLILWLGEYEMIIKITYDVGGGGKSGGAGNDESDWMSDGDW